MPKNIGGPRKNFKTEINLSQKGAQGWEKETKTMLHCCLGKIHVMMVQMHI